MADTRHGQHGPPQRGGRGFASISSLIPATHMYTPAKMDTPRSQGAHTYIQANGKSDGGFQKMPPISNAVKTSMEMSYNVGAGPVQAARNSSGQGMHTPRTSGGQGSHSSRTGNYGASGSNNRHRMSQNGAPSRDKDGDGDEFEASYSTIMALDKHELELISKAIQDSEFYTNAGKISMLRIN